MDPVERSFKIEFEEDVLTLIENHDYHARSIFKRSDSHEEEISAEPTNLLSEAELRNSFMSAELSTIQRLDETRSLLILNITCHPAPGRRFINACVDWQFRSPPPTPSLSANDKSPSPSPSPARRNPRIAMIAPLKSNGGLTEEQTKLIWGLSVPLQVGFGGSSVGLEPSQTKETQKDVIHVMSIVGSARDNMSRAFWTIEENKSSERGIPSHFQLAVAVEHNGPFVVELEIKAELGGTIWPAYVLSKKGLKRLIDVETWRCGEIELGTGEKAWRAYLRGLTGEIPGAVREFEQAIVRP